MILLILLLACQDKGEAHPPPETEPGTTDDTGHTTPDTTAPTTWYADCDGDGFGDPWSDQIDWIAPPGTVGNALDCDDTRADVFPGAAEACDGVDHDCDGLIDEDDSADAPSWWPDADGDGYGDSTSASPACAAPSGSLTAGGETDCDDADPEVFPGAEDSCGDGIDADCDGADIACGRERSLDLATWAMEGDSIRGELGTYVALADDSGGDALLAQVRYGFVSVCQGLVVAGGTTGTLAPSDAAATLTDLCTPRAWADLNGDGNADLIGTVSGSSGSGSFGWAGPIRGTQDLSTADWTLESGDYIAGPVGDVDGDGIGDLWLGTNDSTLNARLVLGPSLAHDTVVAEIAETSSLADNVATLLGSADLNGDGISDLVGQIEEASSYDTSQYVIAAWLGPHTGLRDREDAEAWLELDKLDEGALSAGDLDGDGYDDVALGLEDLPEEGDHEGQVFVFSGPPVGELSLEDAFATFTGESPTDRSGTALAADADINGDGQVDLLIGSPGAPEGWHSGAVHVVLGPLDAGAWSLADSDQLWEGADREYAGIALDAGDVDGDGAAEILVGAPGWEPSHLLGQGMLVPGCL